MSTLHYLARWVVYLFAILIGLSIVVYNVLPILRSLT